ncbi:MAG: tryptophan--tRNA ligase, partial [Pseudomonadota bacterium]
EKTVTDKVRKMPTDPARVRRNDPGDPKKCSVWELHQVYSTDDTKKWVEEGCKTAGIGCLDCKQPLIDAIIYELRPMRERAAPFEEDPTLIKNILADGCEKARDIAEETMRDVRGAMGLDYK